MAHVQKADFVFRRNGRVHFNRPRRRQFSQLLAARGVRIGSSNARYTVFWGSVKGTGSTHSIRQFALHFSSCASPCAITFQLESKTCIIIWSVMPLCLLLIDLINYGILGIVWVLWMRFVTSRFVPATNVHQEHWEIEEHKEKFWNCHFSWNAVCLSVTLREWSVCDIRPTQITGM